eukprot:gnl/TRDRNA2_/TRDRNA2_160890_c0_seq1.p1 gnl/TRDRNA2_/TRDRNA2_160890_c0~~gnl/TRDRNA2_/TRDRNA2_160890_c0_seq1.p1  ORF type:complete len:191 (-),score=34.22 gnl/TRDRNA2_/TRDRNA2_160890_c0_seq1:201-746(-)
MVADDADGGAAPLPRLIRTVFLDIDGVLHAADAYPAGELFLPDCVERLKRIIYEGRASVVLSSSWRLEEKSLAEAKSHLAVCSICIHDVTPSRIGTGRSRAAEIAAWIRMHRDEVESFVVLDDLDLSEDLGCERCIAVDGRVGLRDNDVEHAVRALSRRLCQKDDAAFDALLNMKVPISGL